MKVTIAKTAVALAAVLLTTPAMAQQGGGLAVTVNGRQVMFPGQGPVENRGRVLVPLRGVLENLGAYVSYDSDRQEVRAVRNEQQIILPIGSDTATVNGRPVTLDVPARILNGSTMVPLRFVAESLGARVDYQPMTSTVAIRTRGGNGETGGNSGESGPPPPMPPDAHRVVRGTIVAVHSHEKRLVIQERDGDPRNIDLTPNYHVQRRTPDGNETIDLDRLQPGDRVALEMQGSLARTVTVLPPHTDGNI